MSRSYFVAIPLLLILAVLQTTVLARITILNQPIQLAVVAAISWATMRTLEEGIVWGFIAGIALDFFSIGPTGGNSLAIILAVGIIALLQLGLPPNRFLLPPLFGGIGASAALLIYAALLQISGYTADWSILDTLILFAIAHTALTIPVYWALYALNRILYPPTVENTS